MAMISLPDRTLIRSRLHLQNWSAGLLLALCGGLAPTHSPAAIPAAPWMDDLVDRHVETLNAQSAQPVEMASITPAVLQQFTVGDHVLGFGADHFYLAGMDHALKVEFLGANPVTPQAPKDAGEGREAAPAFEGVRYPELWPGIELSYRQGQSGLIESVYTLQPGADAETIQLRYNRPIALQQDGRLQIAFDTGNMTESAPVAWQEIDGQRHIIEVTFAPHGEREVSFRLGDYDPSQPLWIDPELSWNTFLWEMNGAGPTDRGQGIAQDAAGNVYVTGTSDASWGTPVRAYSGIRDIFVAKLSGSSGVLTWHTFLGGTGGDYGYGVAVDSSGDVLVTGNSDATWGAPVRVHSGFGDAFVAKLSGSDGSLRWNTFLGGANGDSGLGIAADGSGDVLVTGYSWDSWGTPVRAYSGSDAFVAKLSGSTGSLVWNTFLGGAGVEYSYGVAVDSSGDVLVTGSSDTTWGMPVRAYSGHIDVFVVKLSGSTGVLTWNTFLGSTGGDVGDGIAVDGSGDVLVTGFSWYSWGTPVQTDSGGDKAFVAKLSGSTGTLSWNTFFGGANEDYGYDVAVDSSGDVMVTGYSSDSWGTPVQAHSGGDEAFVAKLLGSDGSLVWNTFLGGAGGDYGYGVAVDGSGDVLVTGNSTAAWGTPVRDYELGDDVFAAKLSGTTGSLSWHTFLGWGAPAGQAAGLVADTSGNLYVAGFQIGYQYGEWGTPARVYSGGYDAFVAKLSGSTGSLIWNTFLGGTDDDYGQGIAVDGSGDVLVTGYSTAAWGTPVRPYSGGDDAFVAKLSGSSGVLSWSTFLGSTLRESGEGIAVDGSGDVLVTGGSRESWGAPVRAFSGGYDAFVAKLSGSTGELTWNTFLGTTSGDYGQAIAVDGSGDVLVTGDSNATWGGAPVRAYSGYNDTFVAKVSGSSGTLT